MPNAVYIHIPFCQQKCHYCDFNSYTLKNQSVVEYLNALELEMKFTTEKIPPNEIKTIFIGGGTPTILNAQELEFLFTSIKKYFPNWEDKIEFTVEANPGTVDDDKLKVMKQFGVNRISFGVQAFQEKLLNYIGRIHTVNEVYQSIESAQKFGFQNLSIDLMLGLPHQTIDMLKESLNKAFQLQLHHFSVYSLKVEENTLFHSLYEKNELLLPNEDLELQMYLLTIEEMHKHGYNQYEISNFAKSNFESKHNINYWKNRDYYGLGAGAHGYINSMRYENERGIIPYSHKLLKENTLPIIEKFNISTEEKQEDMLMLGLRMIDGVKFSDYQYLFKEDITVRYSKQIDNLIKNGLLTADDKGIKLSKKGLIYGNDVFAEFISI